MKITQEILTEKAIDLLKKLICIPSFSGEEDKTGDAIEEFLRGFGVKPKDSTITFMLSINILMKVSPPCCLTHTTIR